MQIKYFEKLKELLFKLKNSEGHFIIQNGYFDAQRKRGNEFFCPLVKNGKDESIRFEAISHHFDKSVDQKLASNFFELGFSLEDEENYAKNIFLNSDFDIKNTALEIVKIFENFYKVNSESEYDFDDEIKKLESTSEVLQNDADDNIDTKQKIQNQKPGKISTAGWFFIILGIIVCYYIFSEKKDSVSTSISSNEFLYTVNQESFAATNKSDFDDMYLYAVDNDTKALKSMIDDGLAIILPQGTDVYIVDAGISYSIIRISGTTQKLWIATERISKK